ncbi:MAG: helix-turn-helix domain-containing protein [Actinobacteria bacterium]|nr:helix-turn-helix domain-containing protein [Actinomycetota bacterium]
MDDHKKTFGSKLLESLDLAIDHERGAYTPPRYRTYVEVSAPPDYSARHIREVRERLQVSQHVFAQALNVSPATVKAWEQGQRTPSGPTLRLLELAEKHATVFVELMAVKER